MNSFSQKYPAFASLLIVFSTAAKDLVAPVSLAAKFEGLVNIVSPVIAFMPQASLLSAEIAALKASPSDIEAAGEALVSDLAFSSSKAVAIIAAAFPVAEAVVALIPQSQALISAIKA